MQAFAETHYIVHHEAPFTMHIGQPGDVPNSVAGLSRWS
jgi:hypothetical protein